MQLRDHRTRVSISRLEQLRLAARKRARVPVLHLCQRKINPWERWCRHCSQRRARLRQPVQGYEVAFKSWEAQQRSHHF